MTLLRRNSKTAAIPEPVPVPIEAPEAQHPPLLLLTTDAASLSARRVHTFADPDSAAGFIGFWFTPESRPRVAAFWALPAVPIDAESEAVVLIRHPSDPGLVYPFSFPSMDQALRMVRAEMRRGLRIGSVAIYHAVRVTFDATPDGDLLVTPAFPPPFEKPSPLPRHHALFHAAPEDNILSRAFHSVRLRRWTWHAAPFAGFGSPPGRF